MEFSRDTNKLIAEMEILNREMIYDFIISINYEKIIVGLKYSRYKNDHNKFKYWLKEALYFS